MPKFKPNPNAMSSGYRMKYQGNSSAFPFKQSPPIFPLLGGTGVGAANWLFKKFTGRSLVERVKESKTVQGIKEDIAETKKHIKERKNR